MGTDERMPQAVDRQGLFSSATKYSGVLGTTEFDEFGDTKNKLITFYIVKNGEFVPLETVQAE